MQSIVKGYRLLLSLALSESVTAKITAEFMCTFHMSVTCANVAGINTYEFSFIDVITLLSMSSGDSK